MLDEKAIVGAAIMSVTGHNDIDLSPLDFEDSVLGRVWESIMKMRDVDPLLLQSLFPDDVNLITETMNTLTMTNMRKVAARIKLAAHRRRLLKSLVDVHGMVKGGSSIADISPMLMRALDGVSTGDEWNPVSKYLLEAYNDIERAQVDGVDCNFISTGFEDFDIEFGGLQKNGLIVVSARPGSGKSALAAGIARRVATHENVLIISMEMTGKQLAMRYYASEGRVDLQDMMKGNMTAPDWSRMAEAQGRLMDSGLDINDKTSRTIGSVLSEARRYKRVKGSIGMVVVDYLSLMDLGEANRIDSISEATRSLKVLSGELECPVMLLVQMNRDVEKRSLKEPQMSDLRDCGSIEQDADQIIFPFRPSMFGVPNAEDVAIIHMAKNRNGRTGKVKMRWVGKSACFVNET